MIADVLRLAQSPLGIIALRFMASPTEATLLAAATQALPPGVSEALDASLRAGNSVQKALADPAVIEALRATSPQAEAQIRDSLVNEFLTEVVARCPHCGESGVVGHFVSRRAGP